VDYTDLPITDFQSGTEAQILCFALERVHKQFAWKTGGLSADQLRRQHPPSTMTIAGLIKHMAFVEDGFTAMAHDRPLGPPWDNRDWVANDDYGWRSAVTDDPAELYALWYAAVDRSGKAWTEMINDGGLDITVAWGGNNDEQVSRRRILIDLLEE